MSGEYEDKDEEKNEDEDDRCISHLLADQLYLCVSPPDSYEATFDCFDPTCCEQWCTVSLAVGETQVDMTNKEVRDFFKHFSATVAHCTDTGDCYTISVDMGAGKVGYTKKLMR
jgi:hypothetical protein